MKIDKKYKLSRFARSVKKKIGPRANLSAFAGVWYDPEEKSLWVTNANAAVQVPCEPGDQETACSISLEAMKAADDSVSHVIHITEAFTEAAGISFPKLKVVGNLTSEYQRIMALLEDTESGFREVRLDPEQLLLIAKTMGTKSVTLRFTDESKAIEVRCNQYREDKALGLLMKDKRP